MKKPYGVILSRFRKFYDIGPICLLFLLCFCPSIQASNSTGPGTVFTLSENLDVDSTTGTASLSIPIEVPQGRAGIQPNIGLLYNSSAGNGILGVGWNMELGAIQRSTKKGVPQYNNSDTFILFLAGLQQELVDISGGKGTEFRPEREGAFMRILFDGNSWTLIDKKGTKYFFGTSPASRLSAPGNAQRIFQWHIDRVEDINGNYMTAEYIGDASQITPSKIKYTGNTIASLPTYALVNFNYEPRSSPSDFNQSYMPGFKIGCSTRLKSIEVFAGGNLIRTYLMNYASDLEMNRSLLKSVSLIGADGVSVLPATTMTYTESAFKMNGMYPIVNRPNVELNFESKFVQVIDMNGDGKADILYGPAVGTWQIYFNQSSGDTIKFSPPVPVTNSPPYGANNADLYFTDFNVDGAIDVVYGRGKPYKIWINNQANGFMPPSITANSPSTFVSDHDLVQFVDMNNDGKTDILETASAPGNPWRIYFNTTGSDFSAPVNALNSPAAGMNNLTIKMGDFNGDGLIDVIQGQSTDVKIWVNNGLNGFNPAVATKIKLPFGLNENRIQLADMNGDGLTDIISTFSPTSSLQSYQVYINNGNLDFNPAVVYTNPPRYGFESGIVRLMDMNNDGQLDVVVLFPQQGFPWQVWFNNGNNGFLLPTSFLNPLGSKVVFNRNFLLADINADGRMDILYGDSIMWGVELNVYDSRSSHQSTLIEASNSFGGRLEIQYQNLPIKGFPGMRYITAVSPFLFNSVKSLTSRGSLAGDFYVMKFDYQKGLWDNTNREFRGFKTVQITDAQGNYRIHEFAQDDVFKGTQLSQASYDSNGKLFNKSENTWANQVLYPHVNFPFIAKTDYYIFDGNTTGRRTQEQYFYQETPQYGNITKTINLGEVDLSTGVDIGTDMYTTEVEYHNNTVVWLLGIPKITTTKDYKNVQFAKSTFYYDNNPNAAALPARGLLTKKVNWAGDLSGTEEPFVSYMYDTFGNPVAVEDFKGSRTTMNYDPAYKMFLVETTNPAGHKIINDYYGVNDVPLKGADGGFGLWGQLRSTTDPNNQKSSRVYDVFGRTVKMVSPLDTINLPTKSYEYLYGVSQLKIITRQRIQAGLTGTVDTVDFYDGLGRLVQTKRKSEIPGRFTVEGQSEYNSNGLPVKQYGPYFTSTPLSELNDIDPSKPFTSLAYDAVGRMIKTTAPDGAYANVIYDDWNSTSYDENGHMLKSYADAFGRLIKKEEYLGQDGRHPVYPASAYSLYSTTYFTYDLKGNLVQTKDAKNNITTFVYDSLGRKVQMTDPDMGTWKYGYDVGGNLIWQEDAKGQRINFNYDQINRLKSKSDLSVMTVNYAFDEGTFRNSKGRLTQSGYPGGSTDFRYDKLGREFESVKTIGSTKYKVGKTYDALNRLVSVQYPNDLKVGYTYNQSGQINSAFQVLPNTIMPPPSGGEQAFLSSPHSQFRMNENAGNAIVANYGTSKIQVAASTNTALLSNLGKIGNAFKFNGINNYINLDSLVPAVRTDSKGTFTFWVNPEAGASILNFGTSGFGKNGGIFSISWSPSTQSAQFFIATNKAEISCYTNQNSVPKGYWTHVAVVQDGTKLKIYINGIEQALTFGVLNNGSAWLKNAPLSSGRIAAYAGGPAGFGNIPSLKGQIDDLRYYSNKGLLPEEVKAIYNNSLGTEAENPVITDSSLEPVTVPPSAGQIYVKNVNYNSFGDVSQIEYGNGVITTYTYFPQNLRLSNIRTTNSSGTVLQDLNYTYDGVGNILTIKDSVNTATQSFKYDALNRLIEATGVSYGLKKYVYDEIGNIIEKDGVKYTYSKIGAGPHAVTSLSDGTTMEYDLNGNMVTKAGNGEVREYIFDKENRLFQVRKNMSLIAEYLYDGDGGRVQKTSYVAKLNTVTGGSYGALIGTLQVVETPVVSKYVGNIYEQDDNIGTSFIYLGNQRIAAIDSSSGSPAFYHTDYLGSTNVVTSSTGQIQELIEYDPFGKIQRHDSIKINAKLARQQFTGKMLDDETGLIFFGARYYDPQLGRFITADTIVQSSANPQTLNRYSYTSNNPINRVDNDGHKWSWKRFFRTVGIIVAGAALTVASGGLLTPLIGTFLTSVVTGAMIGATIGGAFAAATGGNIGRGMLLGAVSGAVSAGLTPFLPAGTDLATKIANSYATGFAAGGISYTVDVEVYETNLIPFVPFMSGLMAVGLTLVTETALWMRSKMIEQSRLDPQNASGNSAGFKGDGFKLGGGRYNPSNPGAAPSPLGGHQGGQGRIGFSKLGFNYSAGNVWDRIVEMYAGPHDFLNSFAYDSVTGDIKSMCPLGSWFNAWFVNPFNVALATPLAVPSALPQSFAPPVFVIYGNSQ